ncbi:MAG TPA: polysaccharide pyruvyl transferase family protein [Actinomycetes bacterium]|nr:polysaccharide pyruvyl transferase family protein [Actinomycetes bacterium]
MRRANDPRQEDAKPAEIYLIGTAGHPNYGDELITAGWLRYYAHALPDAKIWLDTPRPGQSAVLLDGIHPGLRCVDSLYHAAWNTPSQHPSEVLDFGQRVVREPGLIPREATGIENFGTVDLVHIIGGGFLNGIWPHHLSLIAAAGAIAEVHGAKTAITGAGLSPFAEDSQEWLGPILSRFDVVDVRDKESRAALAPYVPQLTQTSDDSFLDLIPELFDSSRSTRTALNIQSDMLDVSLDEIAAYTIKTLQHWGVDQDPITLYECMPPNDSAIVPLLQSSLPKLEVVAYSKLWRNGFPSELGQRWITTRMHTHLMAAAQGASGLIIPTGSDYYRVKHQSLIDLGSDWMVAPNLTEPIDVDPRPKIPYGGRLDSIRLTKRDVAAQVVALAPSTPQRDQPRGGRSVLDITRFDLRRSAR